VADVDDHTKFERFAEEITERVVNEKHTVFFCNGGKHHESVANDAHKPVIK